MKNTEAILVSPLSCSCTIYAGEWSLNLIRFVLESIWCCKLREIVELWGIDVIHHIFILASKCGIVLFVPPPLLVVVAIIASFQIYFFVRLISCSASS